LLCPEVEAEPETELTSEAETEAVCEADAEDSKIIEEADTASTDNDELDFTDSELKAGFELIEDELDDAETELDSLMLVMLVVPGPNGT
jgi:hypothetical protein